MRLESPSDEQIREILTKAPFFEWPTFDHMPLNCFDLTVAVMTFPGDISQSRVRNTPGESAGYADYKVDITDLNTCPRKDELFDTVLWSEETYTAPWFFGRMDWACLIDAGDFVLRQGFFGIGVSAARFQNIEGVINITDIEQLKHALLVSLTPHIERGSFKPIEEAAIFTKTINGRQWAVARSLDHHNFPTYRVASAIDFQTAIVIPATLSNCWFWDEVIPEEIEQKHLASFWDFLGHINLTYTRDSDFQAGTIVREAPGQAEKIDDLPEW